MDENRQKELIYNFLKDTLPVFKKSKYYTLLIEKHTGKKGVTISINELRSALFHLYKVLESPEKAEENIFQAKEHINRTALDTYSIICSTLIENIDSNIKKFKESSILTIFPDYHSKILPTIISIKST